MKLECKADPRSWAEIKDAWTRNDMLRFSQLLAANLQAASDEGREKAASALRAFYQEVITDCALVDVNGKAYKGVEEAFGADDLGDLDAAVARFWALLPRLAYEARMALGEAKRVS